MITFLIIQVNVLKMTIFQEEILVQNFYELEKIITCEEFCALVIRNFKSEVRKTFFVKKPGRSLHHADKKTLNLVYQIPDNC